MNKMHTKKNLFWWLCACWKNYKSSI